MATCCKVAGMYDRVGLFPAAVVVAICLFVLKESLEAWRRRATNRRKLRAIKALLAAECERNNWALKWIKDAARDVAEACKEGWPLRIEVTATGVQRLFREYRGGEGSSPIPRSHTAMLDKYLFEAASLDAKLFEAMRDAMEATIELTHLREGLIEHAIGDQQWLEGWPCHALQETPGISASFDSLYRRCTGVALTKWRVR